MNNQARGSASPSPDDANAARRAKAEQTFTARDAPTVLTLSPEGVGDLLHELQVHQIELEMQNEELRQLQGALIAARERYFDLYNLAPIGYLTLSEKGLITEANLAVATLFGIPRRAIIKQRLTAFIDSEDQDIYYLHRKQLMATQQAQRCTVRITRPEQAVRWARLDMALAAAEQDAVPITRIVLSDITEVQQALQALQVSADIFHNVIAQSSEGIVLADQDGIVIEWNAAQEAITGLARSFALGKPIWEVQFASGLEEEQRAEIYAQVRATVQQALTTTHAPWFYQPHERKIVRPDGSIRTIESIAFPIRTAERFLIGSMVRDITQRKQAEAERAQLQAQLAQAQKMETVGRLAGGIAHDFNNMLAVILLRSEMALQQVETATPLHRSLTAIHTTAQHSAELVRQLLGYARKQTIAPVVLDLNATVAGTMAMLRQLIGEEIELSWQPGADLWPVKLDPAQLDQILANLCVNARDAIAGVGKIVIETRNMTVDRPLPNGALFIAPGAYVVLAVSDNGSGMSEESREHLFEPFFTTKEVGKGSGLGLATVDGIVRQNGGHIQVFSDRGIGASFQIYLPRCAAAAGESLPVQPQTAPRGRGQTILLVEDEPVVLAMTHDALVELGYQVVTAATPDDAIRLLAGRRAAVDLLMTDVIMPEMNGGELAAQLASLQPGLKRLFVSGYPADFVASRGVVEAGVHFLQKPYSLHALAVKVGEALAVA